MIDLFFIDEGIWVLEENGQNVLLKDCLQFEIDKEERKFLFQKLRLVARLLKDGVPLDPVIQEGYLRHLDRQPKARVCDLWEIRHPGRGGRLIFVMEAPDSIIVSAVSKSKGSLSQGINRGVNRWIKFLKRKKE